MPVHDDVLVSTEPLLDRERELYSAMMVLIARWGGNVGSEHGVGTRKRDYMSMSRTEADIAAMRAVKAAFDPSGYLNPAVLFSVATSHGSVL